MKTRILLVLAISFSLFGCRKDISLPNDSLNKLFDAWNWVESKRDGSESVSNPDLKGYTVQLVFRSNGILLEYRNGKRYDKMKFSISEEKTIHGDDSAYLIIYESGSKTNQSIIFKGSDTLILKDECNECYTSVFVKD